MPITDMDRFRNFPHNTCPASRHVQMIAEELYTYGSYPMLLDDPKHCAGSLASVVSSLYQTRSFLLSLGYSYEVDKDGILTWKREETHGIDPV
jgi:hypothetical protein